jgi:hypothetical protein
MFTPSNAGIAKGSCEPARNEPPNEGLHLTAAATNGFVEFKVSSAAAAGELRR